MNNDVNNRKDGEKKNNNKNIRVVNYERIKRNRKNNPKEIS